LKANHEKGIGLNSAAIELQLAILPFVAIENRAILINRTTAMRQQI